MAAIGVRALHLNSRSATVASWLVLVLLAAGFVVFAVRSNGVATHKAQLNDGGVWVTNRSSGKFGRENKPVRQLDIAIHSPTSGSQLDVLQNAEAVVATDGSDVTPVDPSLGTADPKDTVHTKSSDLHLGGDVIALADPSGGIWASHVDTVTGSNALDALASSTKAMAKVAANPKLVVSQSGNIYVVAGSSLTTIPNDGTSFGPKSPPEPLHPAPTASIVALTAVGERPVWLDQQGNVGFAGHSVPVGKDAVLQQPSADANDVLVATPSSLYAIDLGSGRKTTLNKVDGRQAAAPVNLGGCSWGLWQAAGNGFVTHDCDGQTDSGAPAQFTVPSDAVLVFRINRDQLFVNDMTNGGVYDVDGAKPMALSMNWNAFDHRDSVQPNAKTVTSQDKEPPKAVEDDLGARAGTTTVLHVLDNDLAPVGDLLSIGNAGPAPQSEASVQVAPNQQSILATVNPGVAAGTVIVFRYSIDDGESKNGTSTGTVKLTVKAANDPTHAAPTLRENTSASPIPTYPVGADRSVQLDVVSDWRDKEFGDPVHLVPETVTANRGHVSITPDGQLRYVAPTGPEGVATISYKVSTGGLQVAGSVGIRVVVAPHTADPLARPDMAAGVVGSPITIDPLNNDLAGADPIDANAALQLASNVAPQSGLSVATDPDAGVVTVTARKAGTYTLQYSAKFGNAAHTSAGFIRVLVAAAGDASETPIATPDNTAVYGQAPMTVDVLANDYDPRGRLLVVQDAQARNRDALNVSVVDGRWVRVQAVTDHLDPNPQLVTYTISNGDRTATTTLTVSQLPAIDSAHNGPDAEPDLVTVRAGTSIDIPVLDNDSTPSGDPVSLVPDTVGVPGTLPLLDGTGQAYLDGNTVRFIAPAIAPNPPDVHLAYTVENASDTHAPTASGLVTIHVTAAMDAQRNPDHAPTPAELDGRVVSGDSITLRLPMTGQDPDGDPVVVTAIGDADPQRGGQSVPSIGQITAFGADTVTYQAFPGMTGADQFTFTVSDPYGQTSVGTARITVVPPGAPQAPVAVDDDVTVDPSRTLNVDVLANDIFPPGTLPSVEPLQTKQPGVKEDNGIITVAPSSRQNRLIVRYTATNGLASSSANLVVDFQKGFDNPPIAGDLTATPETGAETVTIKHVLSKITDIDDPESKLRITAVDGLPSSAIHGDSITLPVHQTATVLTYHVTDGVGQAVGTIYEAAPPANTPHAISGQVIRVDPGAQATIDISQYVGVKPNAKPYLTTEAEILPEPKGMFTIDGTPSRQQVRITAGKRAGPAALVMQVADGPDFNAAGVTSAMVVVPVVIGQPDPVLTCPTDFIPVPESGVQNIDVGAICHVWQDPDKTRQLSYNASVSPSGRGVTASTSGGQTAIKAVHAKAGSTGTVTITIAGTKATGMLNFQVYALPPPSIGSIPIVAGVAGRPVLVDLGQFISQNSVPEGDFSPWLKRVTSADGGPSARISGTTVIIDLPANEHQTFTYTVQASDSGVNSDRIATATFQVAVTDVPHWPAGYAPTVVGDLPQNDKVTLQWSPPDDGHSRIIRYEIIGGPSTVNCGTQTLCSVSQLKNNAHYNFSIRATNANGSAVSGAVSATPDQSPSAVTGLTITRETSNRITYSWTAPSGDFSPVTEYLVSYTGGGGYQPVTPTTKTIDVANGSPTSFTVRPVNNMGVAHPGPPVSNSDGIASGMPDPPSITGITGTNVAGGGQKAFVISWSQVAANGRGSTHYELLDGGAAVLCGGQTWTSESSCTQTVSNSGDAHTYTVVAANDAGVPATVTPIEGSATSHQSHPSGPQTVTAAGQPEGFSSGTLDPTGTDGGAVLNFTVGASNGRDGTVDCVGDLSCHFDLGPSGGTASQTFGGLNDGQNYNVQLKYCNGANNNQENQQLAIVPCVTSQTYSVTPYGPIESPQISANTNGTTVTVNSSVNANGRNVTMTIVDTDTHYTLQTCSNVGPQGIVTCSGSEGSLAYSKSYHYTLTVTDASGTGRSTVSANTTAPPTVSPPPPPQASIVASQGAAGTSTIGNCTSASDNCHWLDFTVNNFATGKFYWQCISNGSVSFDSQTYGYKINITSPTQSFSGNYCIWGAGYSEAIRINNVTSNSVPHS